MNLALSDSQSVGMSLSNSATGGTPQSALKQANTYRTVKSLNFRGNLQSIRQNGSLAASALLLVAITKGTEIVGYSCPAISRLPLQRSRTSYIVWPYMQSAIARAENAHARYFYHVLEVAIHWRRRSEVP